MKLKKIVTCIIKNKDKILLVKRGKTAPTYPETWSFIHGLIGDRIIEDKSPLKAAIEEIEIETDLTEKDIKFVKKLEPFEQEDKKIDTIWQVNAFLFETNKDKIILNSENTEYVWIEPERILDYQLIPGILQVLMKLVGRVIPERRGIVAIVYRNPDSFLVVKTKTGNTIFISGGVEKGENEKEAVINEVKEESGIEVKSGRTKKLPFVNKFTYHEGFLKGISSRQTVYLVKVDENVKIKPKGSDVVWVKWMTKDEVKKNLTFDHVKEIFEKSLEYI